MVSRVVQAAECNCRFVEIRGELRRQGEFQLGEGRRHGGLIGPRGSGQAPSPGHAVAGSLPLVFFAPDGGNWKCEHSATLLTVLAKL